VALVKTDVSEEPSASFIRVTRIGELGKTQAVTLMKEALGSSETSVLTRATRRNVPEDTTLHSHRRENLKSYTVINGWYQWLTHCCWLNGVWNWSVANRPHICSQHLSLTN
jgi:hypothetical protein